MSQNERTPQNQEEGNELLPINQNEALPNSAKNPFDSDTTNEAHQNNQNEEEGEGHQEEDPSALHYGNQPRRRRRYQPELRELPLKAQELKDPDTGLYHKSRMAHWKPNTGNMTILLRKKENSSDENTVLLDSDYKRPLLAIGPECKTKIVFFYPKRKNESIFFFLRFSS